MSWGLLVFAGFWAGYWFFRCEALRQGLTSGQILVAFCGAYFSAWIGARGLHALFAQEAPGYSVLGGVFLGTAAAIVMGMNLKHRFSFLVWAGLWTTPVILALIFARVGCLLQGCCPWGFWIPYPIIEIAVIGAILFASMSPFYAPFFAMTYGTMRLVLDFARPHLGETAYWGLFVNQWFGLILATSGLGVWLWFRPRASMVAELKNAKLPALDRLTNS